ncbi:MAG: hypothetical protein HZB56_06110 [Deltaproteobacteria bacterium]|nr:hypothetical protein [Deltaproteobacteria bacterium]
MKRIALVAASLVAVFTCSDVAQAQATSSNETVAFEAVDGFDRTSYGGVLDVTGVVRGDGAASRLRLMTSYTDPEKVAGCERMALLAMSRPGYYVLAVNQTVLRAADGTLAGRYLVSCGLSRTVP